MLGALLCAAPAAPRHDAAWWPGTPAAYDGTVSVLTYNVEGLPGPLGWGRAADLGRISARLRALRRAGRQPAIVALQEAFSANARAIGREAGYRYVVEGPAAPAAPTAMSAADRRFIADGSRWRGENAGKLAGSGLMILSDHPIVRIRRMAFPGFACAGYDCLANKGVLLVTVIIPGSPSPVDIVTTHLNSRNSSGVGDERSLQAYRRQLSLLSTFVNRWHDRAHPLIAAGDLNAGGVPQRRQALRAAMAGWRGEGAYRDAIAEALGGPARAAPPPGDIAAIVRHGTDLQLFAAGRGATLAALAIDVPFGRQAGGMFSDHIGYVARYRLGRQGRPPRNMDSSRIAHLR